MISLFFKLGSLIPVSMNHALWPFTLDSGEQYQENIQRNGWGKYRFPPPPQFSFGTK